MLLNQTGGRLSALLRNTGLYTVGLALSGAAPLLLLPILTRFLSPADYGKVAMFQAIMVMLLPFVGLSAEGVLSVKFFKLTADQYWAYYLACVTAATTAFVVALIAITAARPILLAYTGLEFQWVLIAAVVALGQCFVNLALANFQVRGEAIRYAVYLNIFTLLNMGASVFLVVELDMDWRGRAIGQLLAVVIAGAAGLGIASYHMRRTKVVWANVADVFRFGGPLIPTYALASVNLLIGRTVITNREGLENTGLYLAGFQIASVLLLLLGAFNQAFAPWLFERLKHGGDSARVQIVRLTYAYGIIVIPVALLLGICAPLLTGILLPNHFRLAAAFVPMQALAFAFTGLHMMVVNYVYYAERTELLLISTGGATLLNVVLTIAFVNNFGAIGATYAQAIANAFAFVVVWWFASRVVEMPWLSRSIWRLETRTFL